MADYCSMFRTNYFRTDDEPRLREILEAAELPVWTIEDEKTGETLFGFGSQWQSAWNLVDEDYMRRLHPEAAPGEDDDWQPDGSLFFEDLAQVVAQGDAAIVTEIGWEKLRYLTATSVVISKAGVLATDLEDHAKQLAYTLGVAEGWDTRMEY